MGCYPQLSWAGEPHLPSPHSMDWALLRVFWLCTVVSAPLLYLGQSWVLISWLCMLKSQTPAKRMLPEPPSPGRLQLHFCLCHSDFDCPLPVLNLKISIYFFELHSDFLFSIYITFLFFKVKCFFSSLVYYLSQKLFYNLCICGKKDSVRIDPSQNK